MDGKTQEPMMPTAPTAAGPPPPPPRATPPPPEEKAPKRRRKRKASRVGRVMTFVSDKAIPLVIALCGLVGALAGLQVKSAVDANEKDQTVESLQRQNADLEEEVTTLTDEVVSVTEDRDRWKARAEDAADDDSGPSGSTGSTTPRSGTTTTTSPALGRTGWLSEMTAVDSGGSAYASFSAENQATLNGVVYLHALVAGAECDTATEWRDYDLSRDWSRFTTTVGISDASPAVSSATFNIYVDGVVATTGEVTLGRPAPVDIEVRNGLRLRLEMVNTTCGRPPAERSAREKVVFADPKLTA